MKVFLNVYGKSKANDVAKSPIPVLAPAIIPKSTKEGYKEDSFIMCMTGEWKAPDIGDHTYICG